MSEKPILFSSEMVKAILDSRKTQTRRVVKFKKQPIGDDLKLSHWKLPGCYDDYGVLYPVYAMDDGHPLHEFAKCPYGKPGDHLWVRETWQRCPECGRTNWRVYANDNGSACQHCDGFLSPKWKPSIHMFREDSRITLEVTAVRVERVQDISEEDARAEGVKTWTLADGTKTHRGEFSLLWDSINGSRKDKSGKRLPYAWGDNPWVWVVEFKQLTTTV